MDVNSAGQSIEGILEEFLLLKDERGIFSHWKSLVINLEIKGKTAHDARLVAAMQRHGLTNILTCNKADFARFTTIKAFTPFEILNGAIVS